jgi:hypothetical protein
MKKISRINLNTEKIYKNHYISQGRLKYWSNQNSNKEKVKVYDRIKKKIEDRVIENLFYQLGRNNLEVEHFFRYSFEDQYPSFINNIIKNKNQIKELSKNDISIALSIITIAFNCSHNRDLQSFNSAMWSLMNLSEKEWEEYIFLFNKDFVIIPFFSQNSFFINDKGYFFTPYINNNNFVLACSFPLTPNILLNIVPRNSYLDFINSLNLNTELLIRSSIHENNKEIVIPFNLWEIIKDEDIKLDIETIISGNNNLIKNINRLSIEILEILSIPASLTNKKNYPWKNTD